MEMQKTNIQPFYGLLQENLLNHILMHLPAKKVHYDNPKIKYGSVKLSERELRSLQILLAMLFTNYILSSNFQKINIKIVFILKSLSILLCCKTDSDDTQTLINAKDQGGLWRVNETDQNIFIEYEKIFRSLHQHFA